jgi:APA family basic amino acid/polyamine antiporter
MARDGLFFRRIGTVSGRQVPSTALLVLGIWAAVLTLFRTVSHDPVTGAITYGNVYTQLLEYIVSADMVFYVLMVGAVLVLRRKLPAIERPYRTAGYPLVPLVYITLATLLIVDLAYLTPSTAGAGYVLVLTGLPVYLVWRRSDRAS